MDTSVDEAPAAPDCQALDVDELIGFDNQKADLGVADFLDNAGFVPMGCHSFFATGRLRPPPIKAWTRRWCPPRTTPLQRQALRQDSSGRLDQLATQRTTSIVSGNGAFSLLHFVQLVVSVVDSAVFRSPWCEDHPELMEYTRDGTSANCLSPIKRLADGSYYEDLLIKCVTSVARDYGFDGVHAADGYSSPRLPIWMADYSDDVVTQFTEMMGIALPDEVAPQADAPTPPARIAPALITSGKHCAASGANSMLAASNGCTRRLAEPCTGTGAR